jgi:hypothetical protein
VSRSWERIQRVARESLLDEVPRDHSQPDHDFRRRRVVVAVVLALGAVLLGFSLPVRPGSAAFYPLTLLLATVWAVGGVASGPLHLGYLPLRGALRRPMLTGLLTGIAAGAVFLTGALVVRQTRRSSTPLSAVGGTRTSRPPRCTSADVRAG